MKDFEVGVINKVKTKRAALKIQDQLSLSRRGCRIVWTIIKFSWIKLTLNARSQSSLWHKYEQDSISRCHFNGGIWIYWRHFDITRNKAPKKCSCPWRQLLLMCLERINYHSYSNDQNCKRRKLSRKAYCLRLPKKYSFGKKMKLPFCVVKT